MAQPKCCARVDHEHIEKPVDLIEEVVWTQCGHFNSCQYQDPDLRLAPLFICIEVAHDIIIDAVIESYCFQRNEDVEGPFQDLSA